LVTNTLHQDTLTTFICCTGLTSTNICDFSLITISNTPSISSGFPGGYHIDLTFRNKPITVGRTVPNCQEVLNGLQYSLQEQAGLDMVDVWGRSHTLYVFAVDEPTTRSEMRGEDPKAHVHQYRKPVGFVRRGEEGIRVVAGIFEHSITKAGGEEASEEELS
jgi:hypothetical protein